MYICTMKKQAITKSQFETVKSSYLAEGKSIREVADLLSVSTSFVERIIKDWNMFVPFPNAIEGSKKGDQKKEYKRLRMEKLKENITFDVNRSKSIFEEGKVYFAVCRITGKKFDDYTNSSGALIRHLKAVIPEIEIPTGYKKRAYEKRVGRPWHFRYFDFVEKVDAPLPQRKCAYCEWKTYDLTNSSGGYTIHIREEHKISISQHIEQRPEERDLFTTAMQIESRLNRHDGATYGDDYINCMVCGEKMKYVTNSHLKKHEMTSWEYKLKYPMSMSCSSDFKKRMSIQLAAAQEFAVPKWVSGPETDLRSFVSGLGLEFIGSNRSLLKGIEVDIVIPSLKIGIEFNGNRYHSEVYGKKGRMHHIGKLIKMNDVGYGLIQIFEDEWEERGNQVRSKLKRMLGKDDGKKISARDCDVILIEASSKNSFLNKYHIQGEDRSTIHYGLIYDDDLVAVMTFDPHRNMTQSKEGQYELKRFATKDGLLVRGGAGKLLSSFVHEVKPKSIMSFADRRWTLNAHKNMYTTLGFQFDGSTPPEYHYYNNKLHRLKRWSKFQFGKSSIAKKFPHIYHPEKTEWQMMQEAGFDRIWDCGKFRYILEPIYFG